MRGFNSDEAMNRPVLGTVRVMEDGNIRWSYVSVWAPRWTAKLHMVHPRLYHPRLVHPRLHLTGGSIEQSLVHLSPFNHVTVRRVSRLEACVVQLVSLGCGLMHVITKVGRSPSSHTHTFRRSLTPTHPGDPSGWWPMLPFIKTGCTYERFISQVHSGSSRRTRLRRPS